MLVKWFNNKFNKIFSIKEDFSYLKPNLLKLLKNTGIKYSYYYDEISKISKAEPYYVVLNYKLERLKNERLLIRALLKYIRIRYEK